MGHINQTCICSLPLDSSCAHKHDKVSINWKAISASASVVKFMREIYSSRGQNGPVVDSKCGSSETRGSMPDMIHLANRFAEPQSLKGVVVLAIHTGRIYCVLDVVTGLTADSPFVGNSRKQSSDTWTFSEYLNKKWVISFFYIMFFMLLFNMTLENNRFS